MSMPATNYHYTTINSQNTQGEIIVGPNPLSRWQARLLDILQSQKVEFQVYSDRRGGRTAWSAKIIVDGCEFKARYWYDGNFINNAYEDVAEVVVKILELGNVKNINISNMSNYDIHLPTSPTYPGATQAVHQGGHQFHAHAQPLRTAKALGDYESY
jgi:hypothetical protein